MKKVNNDIGHSSSALVVQLMTMCLNDYNFAAILLDEHYNVQKSLLNLNIDFNSQDKINSFPDATDAAAAAAAADHLYDDDCYSYTPFYIYLKDDINQSINHLSLCEWFTESFFKEIINAIFGIAHMKNMIYLASKWVNNPQEKEKEKEKEKCFIESINFIKENAANLMLDSSINKGFNATENKEILLTLIKNYKTEFSSVLESNKLLAIDESEDIFNKFLDIITDLATAYNSDNLKHTSVEILYSDNIKYKPSYKYLNKNYKICEMELPIFESTNRLNFILNISHLKVEKLLLENAISYTLGTDCDCDYDCCGCVTYSYSAYHINDKYLHINVTKTQNI
jgi:hypothetical protein